MSNLLKDRAFTNLERDFIRSHPSRAVHKERPLGRMRATTSRAVDSILDEVKQDSSFPGIPIEFSNRELSLQLNGFFFNVGVRG